MFGDVLTTVVSVLAAIALLVPGFVVAELSLVRKARSSRGDLELALRAVTYAFVIHLAFAYWTTALVERVGEPARVHAHIGAIALYAFVVLLAVPVLLGVGLSRFLAAQELVDGPPNLWAAALGAGEARDAFDYAFQRRRNDGAWVIVELTGHSEMSPRLVGGIFGRRSAVGQTPSAHDVYLESLCTVAEDEHGVRYLAHSLDPPRGVYLAASEIARIELLPRNAEDPPEGPGTLPS